jgi:hypothetical protein
MATGSKRKRNYEIEYLIRIARGLAGGKSRSQARGHARAADLPSTAAPQPFKRSEPLEDALKLMKKGMSQKEAARQAGVSAETLRRFQKGNTTSRRVGRRWVIVDTRPVSVVMATKGKMRSVTCRMMRPVTSAATGLRSTISWRPTVQRISRPSSARGSGTARVFSTPSKPAQTSCASSIAPASCRSSTSMGQNRARSDDADGRQNRTGRRLPRRGGLRRRSLQAAES